MKTGRNESCPCGSGKKYKVCCGAAPESEAPQILAWRRLSGVARNYAPKLLSFIEESHGPGAILEAWEEFTLWSDEPFDPQSPHVTLFYPWLFHAWRPLTGETEVEARCLHSIPPSQAYLIARAKSTDPLLYRYLSACLDSPFGFFEVVSVDPGRGMQMREILTETPCSVLEHSASKSLQPGDTVYGMVVECDGVVMLEASAPFAIPVRLKPRILEERERLLEDAVLEREELAAMADEERASGGDANEGAREDDTQIGAKSGAGVVEPPIAADAEMTLDKFALFRHDFSNRELYWELESAFVNPAPPELHNTDGDRLSMRRLIFAIESPADAFAALQTLALGHSRDDLLQDAKYTPDGALQRVELHWTKRGNSTHKGLETTVLGRIEIDGTQLAAEVNSAERAKELIRLVSERMGGKARYRATEIQSMERLLSEARAKPTRDEDRDQAALMAQPEVQAQIRGMMKRHYEAWMDEKLPALKGQTPREAVRTKTGKEKVAALIQDIERMGRGMAGYDISITNDLRKGLGIG
jgi:hypothetical protein